MKVNIQSDQPIDDASCKAATGKTYEEWFALLDEYDGIKKGRREVNNYLYETLKPDLWWCTTIAVNYEEARGQKEKDGRLKGYFICSTKTISAPVDKVYAAWASSDALSKWFGDGVKAEVSDGGSFDDGDGNTGEYKRVRQNKDLRFTWKSAAGESLVDMQLTDKGGGKTGLLVNHDRLQTREEADGVRVAWAEAINRLKAFVEA